MDRYNSVGVDGVSGFECAREVQEQKHANMSRIGFSTGSVAAEAPLSREFTESQHVDDSVVVTALSCGEAKARQSRKRVIKESDRSRQRA